MTPLTLVNTRTGSTARILPAVGFNLFQLQLPVGERVVEVLDAEPEFATTGNSPSHNGIPLLFPFPNRIRGGRYTWGGREYVLEGARHDAQGNAIHGLVIDRPWRVIQTIENRVVGQFQLSVDAPDRRALWPADFLIEVRYELKDAGLHCDVRVANPDRVPLPFGFGTHPYFRVPLSSKSKAGDCLIQAPAAEEWELVGCLPTGKQRPAVGPKDLREGQELAGLKLDDAFTGLAASDGRIETVVMDPSAGLEVRQSFDTAFRDLVVYTPPHGRSVCLEPYTCMTDAIHLAEQGIDGGWRVLGPGAEFRTWFQITASLVYA
ncbi:MAG: aldose 1-epimerase [Planctomycetia bacterium]|nr:aldose 1-epimerase [Planctomycetia bacterium]